MAYDHRLAALESAVNVAARELLFLAGVEGIRCLSRGGKGCVYRALAALRPDIAKKWESYDDAFELLKEYFPDPTLDDA